MEVFFFFFSKTKSRRLELKVKWYHVVFITEVFSNIYFSKNVYSCKQQLKVKSHNGNCVFILDKFLLFFFFFFFQKNIDIFSRKCEVLKARTNIGLYLGEGKYRPSLKPNPMAFVCMYVYNMYACISYTCMYIYLS